MTAELSTALTVLIVGMLTVFVILGLIVVTGQLLIRIVNRYAPTEANAARGRMLQPVLAKTQQPSTSASKIAAITAAVERFSGGKAKIKSIERVRRNDEEQTD